ncbi:hypothetical protein TNCV_1955821 [Trichonephila clavipes]|nr:hypothetical protein TNCV_1955821 [Trichonephila clavipes]
MSSSQVPLKTYSIGVRCTLNLSKLKRHPRLLTMVRNSKCSAHLLIKKTFIRFSKLVRNQHPKAMALRKGLIPDEIANLLREFSENESDGG